MSGKTRAAVSLGLAVAAAVLACTSCAEGSAASAIAALLAILSQTPRLRGGLGAGLLAAGLVALASSPGTGFYALPLLALAPLAAAPPPRYLRGSTPPPQPLGPASMRMLYFFAGMLPVGLVYPSSWLPLGVLSLSIPAWSLISYTVLRAVRVTHYSLPRAARIGSHPRAVIVVATGRPSWVIVSTGHGWARLVYARGEATVEVPLPAHRIGLHRVRILVHAYDESWLAGRRVLSTVHEYRVLPAAPAVLRRMGAYEPGTIEAGLYATGAEGPRRMGPRGVEELLAGLGRGGGAVLASIAVTAFSAAAAARRGRIGEYLGSRLYIPGDDPRTIHWKKIVKLHELVVKEYAEPPGAGGGGGGGGRGGRLLVVVSDLGSASREELDAVLRETVGLVAERGAGDVLLLLHYAGRLLSLRGSPEAVLGVLAQALRDHVPEPFYSYASPPRRVSREAVAQIARAAEEARVVEALASTLSLYAQGVVGVLAGYRVLEGRAGIVVVHGPSTAARNAFLAFLLEEKTSGRGGVEVVQAAPPIAWGAR